MKRTLLVVVSLALVLGCFTVASAAKIEETADFGQQDELALQAFLEPASESQAENLIEAFLIASKAPAFYTRSATTDPLAFVAQESIDDPTIAYKLAQDSRVRAVNEALNISIVSDQIRFSDFAFKQEGNHAVATVLQSYTYTDSTGYEGNTTKTYTIDLSNDMGCWKIERITSDDPWEQEEGFSYEVIDENEYIAKFVSDNNALKQAERKSREELEQEKLGAQPNATGGTTDLYEWTYDPDAAVAYAKRWYNGFNPIFDDAGEDCQNFASQCVWAGFGGTSKNDRPAVTKSMLGTTDASNIWNRGVASTHYPSSQYKLNWTWDNAQGFAKMMAVSSVGNEGPYGNTYYGSLQHADAGDVIAWDTGHNPSDTTLDHAMFVTRVDGTGMEDIYIAAHNKPTSSEYHRLSDYAANAGVTASDFSVSTIWRGNYAVRQ